MAVENTQDKSKKSQTTHKVQKYMKRTRSSHAFSLQLMIFLSSACVHELSWLTTIIHPQQLPLNVVEWDYVGMMRVYMIRTS